MRIINWIILIVIIFVILGIGITPSPFRKVEKLYFNSNVDIPDPIAKEPVQISNPVRVSIIKKTEFNFKVKNINSNPILDSDLPSLSCMLPIQSKINLPITTTGEKIDPGDYTEYIISVDFSKYNLKKDETFSCKIYQIRENQTFYSKTFEVITVN